MSWYKPRIAAAPLKVQMVKAGQIHQAQHIGATAWACHEDKTAAERVGAR